MNGPDIELSSNATWECSVYYIVFGIGIGIGTVKFTVPCTCPGTGGISRSITKLCRGRGPQQFL